MNHRYHLTEDLSNRCCCWTPQAPIASTTPASQSLSFSSMSRYAYPSFFPLHVILSIVRVVTQQWLSHIHVTHARVSHTWWLTCSWLITGYESIRFSLYLVSWHYLLKRYKYAVLLTLLYFPFFSSLRNVLSTPLCRSDRCLWGSATATVTEIFG